MARNVDDNHSTDDVVVSYRVIVVVKHPSVIKCGISFVVVENSSDRWTVNPLCVVRCTRLRIG